MPADLMAALVTRLADHLPIRRVFGELPFSNFAPSRTGATRWGALTARQWAWADSMSLKATATPAARELPGGCGDGAGAAGTVRAGGLVGRPTRGTFMTG